jgi:phosphoribosyl 1,2-cyclic phosphate phosphodiesterase
MNGYPAILNLQPELQPGAIREIAGEGGPVAFLPLDQDHGAIRSLGFRIGDLAYCNDVVGLPDETLSALKGIRIFIIDALRHTPHPSHANLTQALDWAAELKPELTVLTNMHIDMDYRTLQQMLQPGVVPGYDGLQIGFTDAGAVRMRTRAGWPEIARMDAAGSDF